MQLVSALAPAFGGTPAPATVLPADPNPGSAPSDFLELLLNTGWNPAPQPVDVSGNPVAAAPKPRTTDREEEPEPTPEEKQPRSNETPVLVADPKVVTPQPLLFPLSWSSVPPPQPAQPVKEPEAAEAKPVEAVSTPLGPPAPAAPPAPASVAIAGAAPASPEVPDWTKAPGKACEAPEQDVAFTLNLVHSMGPAASEAPVKVRPAVAKQTSAMARPPVAPPETNTPQAQSCVRTVSAVGSPRGDSRSELDHGGKRGEPEANAPAAPQRDPPVSAALDHPVPVATGQPVAAETPAHAEAPAPIARPTAPEPPAGTTKAAPLREISLKVPGNAERPLDLHIVDDRGRLHIEVRTSDQQLASSLREHVGDLVQKLDGSGFRTESSAEHHGATPVVAAGQGSGLANDNGGKPGTGDQQPPADRGSSGQPGQQQQNGQGRGNRPRWLEEIVRNFNAAADEKENED